MPIAYCLAGKHYARSQHLTDFSEAHSLGTASLPFWGKKKKEIDDISLSFLLLFSVKKKVNMTGQFP